MTQSRINIARSEIDFLTFIDYDYNVYSLDDSSFCIPIDFNLTYSAISYDARNLKSIEVIPTINQLLSKGNY